MTMYKIGFCVYIFLFILLSGSFCEEYNLYGEAGQAYAVEIGVGHPHQKVNKVFKTSINVRTVDKHEFQQEMFSYM